EWQKVVSNGRQWRPCRLNVPRISSVRYVEEEDPVLASQEAQEAAAREHVAIRGEVHVVGLITRGRHGRRSDYLPISLRALIEVDHRDEVRRDAGLVPGPNVESSRLLRIVSGL